MITLTNNRKPNQSSGNKPGIGKRWIRVASDSFSLAELQFQLFQLDAKTWVGASGVTLVTFAFGIVFALSGLLVLFGAAAIGLTLLGMHLFWALLSVGGAGLLAGGLLVLLAVSRLRRTFAVFERSRTEMANNMEWLKKQFS
jgi:hypothetical protein